MIQKFAASDDLKISQVEIISECESLLNVSMRMRLTILCLELLSDLCRYQFHPKPSPLQDKPPGHDLKVTKTLPLGQSLCTKSLPSGQSLCTKSRPSGQNRESEALPLGHKVRKFHECIYKL